MCILLKMTNIKLGIMFLKRWLLLLGQEVSLSPIMFPEISVRLSLLLKVANIISIHDWFEWRCINSDLKCLARIICVRRTTELLVVWLKVLLLLVNDATMLYVFFASLKWGNVFTYSWVVSNLEVRMVILQRVIVMWVVFRL